MRRIVLAVVVALAAGQAREVETGLAVVRQRLAGHPVAQRKLSGVQHRAALVSGTLAEKLEAWHEFVRHYRTRLAEVEAELAAPPAPTTPPLPKTSPKTEWSSLHRRSAPGLRP